MDAESVANPQLLSKFFKEAEMALVVVPRNAECGVLWLTERLLE
jgi:hypothetical protein